MFRTESFLLYIYIIHANYQCIWFFFTDQWWREYKMSVLQTIKYTFFYWITIGFVQTVTLLKSLEETLQGEGKGTCDKKFVSELYYQKIHTHNARTHSPTNTGNHTHQYIHIHTYRRAHAHNFINLEK